MASAHLRGLNKAELQDVGNEVGLPEYVAIPAPTRRIALATPFEHLLTTPRPQIRKAEGCRAARDPRRLPAQELYFALDALR